MSLFCVLYGLKSLVVVVIFIKIIFGRKIFDLKVSRQFWELDSVSMPWFFEIFSTICTFYGICCEKQSEWNKMWIAFLRNHEHSITNEVRETPLSRLRSRTNCILRLLLFSCAVAIVLSKVVICGSYSCALQFRNLKLLFLIYR